MVVVVHLDFTTTGWLGENVAGARLDVATLLPLRAAGDLVLLVVITALDVIGRLVPGGAELSVSC